MIVMKASKTIGFFLLIVVCTFFVSGCNSEQKVQTNGSNTTKLDVDTSDMEVLQCSRDGEVDNATTDLQYEVFYQGDYIQILHSTEKIISGDQDILDQYEAAYQGIFVNYEGLEYYDNVVTREEDSVTSDTVINYAKIDTDRLLEIEGEEDNVIEDGKVKLDTWLEFAEQFGVTCE